MSLLSEVSCSTWNTVGLVVWERCFFSVSCWWLVFHVEQLWLWVWGCCWELEMGLLMECFTWNVEVCLGWFVGISRCGFERWNRISLTVEWVVLSCWRMVGVSRETWWVVGVYLVAVFHVKHGWGCMCGMLELRKRIWMYVEVGSRFLHSWPSGTGFMTVWLFHVEHCFCFTTSQGCQCVSRETQGGVVKLLLMVFENSFPCRCWGGGVSRETLVLNLIQLLGNAV